MHHPPQLPMVPSGGSGYGSGCRYQGPHSRRRSGLVTVAWWRTWTRVLPGKTTDGTVGVCSGSTHGTHVAWSCFKVMFLRLLPWDSPPWKTTIRDLRYSWQWPPLPHPTLSHDSPMKGTSNRTTVETLQKHRADLQHELADLRSRFHELQDSCSQLEKEKLVLTFGYVPQTTTFFFLVVPVKWWFQIFTDIKKRCLIKDPLTNMLVEANIHQQKHLFKPTSINKNACLSQHPLKSLVVWSSGFDFLNFVCPEGWFGLWIASGSDEWRETCSPWFVCFR